MNADVVHAPKDAGASVSDVGSTPTPQVGDSGVAVGGSPCDLPWGGALEDGQEITAYASSSVPDGTSCASETRRCDHGVLSGSHTHAMCSVEAPPNLCEGGAVVDGVCWYLGAFSESCTEACGDHDGVYDDATRTFAGSGGTDDNCARVLDALAVEKTAISLDGNCSYGTVGCGWRGDVEWGYRRRCGNATSAGAADGYTKRACACSPGR